MQDLLALEEAKFRAVNWLLRRLGPDGSLAPVEGTIQYHRVPWALAVAGRTIEASRHLDWVSRAVLDKEGDFTGQYRGGSQYENHWYTCPNSGWLMGAAALGRWDVVRRAADFLESLQDVDSGGAFNARGPQGDKEPLDVWSTSLMGLAFIAAGRLRAAIRAGRFVADIWQAQPDPDKLYFRHRVGWGCITALDEGVVDAERPQWVMDSQAERQWYFVPGVAAALLARLHQATGDDEWLDAASEYQDFVVNATDKQFDVPEVAENGWGAAILCQITGDAEYREWAELVSQFLRDSQQPDGSWTDSTPEDTASAIRLTAAYVTLSDTILSALAPGAEYEA